MVQNTTRRQAFALRRDSRMNILVIKQTSLGDVLHATPHLRAIKQRYPDAHLTVLTAQGSAEIYANNPHIDRLVLFDYAAYKRVGLQSPRALLAIFKQSLAELNRREYDLAFDLQGLLRSVVFLYGTPAKNKYVKGRWLGLQGFRNKRLHAIDEMSQVLAEADIPVLDNAMQFSQAADIGSQLQAKLTQNDLGPLLAHAKQKPFVVVSPFTRWASKNWPLSSFIETALRLSQKQTVLITGTAQDCASITQAIRIGAPDTPNIYNLAGKLSLSELAALMAASALVISGDSFPMHLATAVGAPLITLFGPTDERKTGPRSNNSVILRPQDCRRCDKPNCASACLGQIPVVTVLAAAVKVLA